MTTDKKETKETKQAKNWLDFHDLKEIYETTMLKILPKYEMIKKDDLTTMRKIKILSLPIDKIVEKDNETLDLTFINISDNDVSYSLPFNSKALQRSLISLAINVCNAKSISEIDLSKVIGKIIGIKRERFTAKGFTQSPLKFFLLGNK